MCVDFFFFNDTATTEIYTLSLHDALPICEFGAPLMGIVAKAVGIFLVKTVQDVVAHENELELRAARRSEEHTSELQSRQYLVCRLLLEKKKVLHSTYRTSY